MIKRKIQITVSDPDSIWKEIEQDVFSDFCFQLPTLFPEQIPDDKSADISFEFIPEDSNIENYIKPGLDPFLNYFFSIRVQKVSDDPQKYQSFQNWVEKSKNSEKPWCVFLAQERFLFMNTSSGLFSQLDSIPTDRQFIIQYKSPLRLAEQQIEQIQTKFQELITQSFLELDSKTMDMIYSEKYPPNQISRFRIWRVLMFFYFGFLESSLKGFQEIYTEFSHHNLKCDVIPPIEPSWITLYPFINGDDNISILIFALSGCFAIFYIKKDYKSILDLFMENLFNLNSKSYLDKNLILNWSSQSLEVMIDLDFAISKTEEKSSEEKSDDVESEKIDLFDNSIDITDQLLMQLFRNRLQSGNQKQIDETYHKLMIRLSEKKYTRTVLNVLYSSDHLFNDMTKCWSFGQTAALNLVEEAIKERKYSRIQFFAKPLFFDNASKDVKAALFDKLSRLDSDVVIKDPFSCRMEFTSDAFFSPIKNGYTFAINAKCSHKLIDMFPRNYDSSSLILRMKTGEGKTVFHKFTSNDVDVSGFTIVGFLTQSGKWEFDTLELKKGSLTFSWTIDSCYCVRVEEYKKPKIHVKFPSLIGFGHFLPISFSVDIATIEKDNASFELFFESKSLEIPDQQGNAELLSPDNKANDCNKATFKVADSVLSFQHSIDRKAFNCDTKFVARIVCKQTDRVTSSRLHVIASVSSTKYEFLFPVVFRFPIECSLRFISAKFAHICLRNTAEVPFVIESAEMQPMTWQMLNIDPGEELFLIGKRSYQNDVLKIFVRDENGDSIAMSWNINEKMMRPIIKAEIKGTPVCGRSFNIRLLDLPACELFAENTKDIIVSGLKKIKKFEGGCLTFSLIPLKSGLLRLPFISLNHVSYVIQQEYVNVIQPKATLLSPLANVI